MATKTNKFTAKWTIDNCPAGRAAKGETPIGYTKKPAYMAGFFGVIGFDRKNAYALVRARNEPATISNFTLTLCE
ncbi:MAG: hypothetical protein IJY11_00025 [Clostridia bacterium]|nr:hypothetical protein [Clostridia bacterium]